MRGALFLYFVIGLIQAAYAVGFDCNSAATEQEKLICSVPALSAQDDELNRVFSQLSDGKVFRLMQRDWLKNVRNRCKDSVCLASAYKTRIQYLTAGDPGAFVSQSMILEGTTLRKDGYSVYAQPEDAWPRYTLFTFDAKPLLLDATVINNVLYAILAIGDGKAFTLYEYADNRDELYPIVHSETLLFSKDFSVFNNVVLERYSGIENGVFYFRVKETDELAKVMRYTLGSGRPATASDRVYQSKGLAERHARARIEGGIETGIDELVLFYGGENEENVTARTGFNYQNWIISQPAWHAIKPILYFDNSGAYACIWRADLWSKTLIKIVPEHEAETPLSVTLNSREAVVYIDQNRLKIVVSPN